MWLKKYFLILFLGFCSNVGDCQTQRDYTTRNINQNGQENGLGSSRFWLNFLLNSNETTRGQSFGNNRNRTFDIFEWTANKIITNIISGIDEPLPADDMPVKFLVGGESSVIPVINTIFRNVTINGLTELKLVVSRINFRAFMADILLTTTSNFIQTVVDVKLNLLQFIEFEMVVQLDFELKNIVLRIENGTASLKAQEASVEVYPVITTQIWTLITIFGVLILLCGGYIAISMGLLVYNKIFKRFCKEKPKA